ncbi:MAG: hypothetical protein KC620_11325 [Myxococcales bacterium]|nr:hypothetical protein [Myxococcales bacterium]
MPVDVAPTPTGDGLHSDAVGPDAIADQDLAGDSAIDAEPNPCAIICDPGERCDPASGTCVSRHFGVPGGACEAEGDCHVGDCLSQAATAGAVPGGFCSVQCADDGVCAGGACVPVEQGRVCFERCDEFGGCRPRWTCAPPTRDRAAICVVDCRVAGCPGQGRCDASSGACEPSEVPCRYDCAVGEHCLDGRCVRLDGSCVTDYHCPAGVTACVFGRCLPVEGTPCAQVDDCDAIQRCVGDDGVGICALACAADGDCPAHRVCRADLGACAYEPCGGDSANGALLGPCRFGSAGRPGTCLPLGNQAPRPGLGYCIEAGIAETGEPCDAQSDGRTPRDRAVQCAPGRVCEGDPDDPLDPAPGEQGRGRCVALCAPGDAAICVADEVCVELGAPDEGRSVGACLRSECDALAPAGCGIGGRCEPYALTDRAGRCVPSGAAAIDEPCAATADCAGRAICIARADGPACAALCDPQQADACERSRWCYAEPEWALGICL